jgi:hypothetical protein
MPIYHLLHIVQFSYGARGVAQLVEAVRYKQERRGFDS